MKPSFIILILLFHFYNVSGQDLDIKTIAVQARVLEQLKGNIRSVANAKLHMIGLGPYNTDEEGRFAFEAPMQEFNRNETHLVLEVKVQGYDIVKPYKGIVQLDTAQSKVYMEILVIGRDLEEEYREELASLARKLKRTEKKNALSLIRMNSMNDSLVASVQQNEKQKNLLRVEITALEKKVATEASEKEKFVESLNKTKKRLDELERSLERKNDELYIALEEQYLRQQNYQKAISADLKDYLLYTKDVHDMLQHLDRYFKPGKYPNYVTTYNNTLGAYNEIFQKLNSNYLNYVKGVERYWKAPLLTQQVKDTFEILLDQLHHPKLKPAIQEINGNIRKNKSRKATKVAHEAFHDMNSLIINLEKSVNRLLNKL